MSTLRPTGTNFLFHFTNDTSSGRFIERSKGSIILTNQDYDSQGKYARFGKVTAIGKDVKDFKVGDIVLIESLKWTKSMEFEGQKVWKSDEDKVLAIGSEEDTYAYSF